MVRPLFLLPLGTNIKACSLTFFIYHSMLQFKPIKKPESKDSGFPCSGDRTILNFVTDGPWGGLYLIAGKDQIYNFLGGYELVVDLWEKG